MAGASLNDIKARMKSVEGTMQITKAMELVATSKLRHAKLRAENTRPFMDVLRREIEKIKIDSKAIPVPTSAGERTLYVVIAGDRGLAGGYNNNLFRLAKELDKSGNGIYLPIGKKAQDYYRRRGVEIFSEELGVVATVGVGDCLKVTEALFDAYINDKFGKVVLIYTKFVSMMTQTALYETLLPFEPTVDESESAPKETEPIYEGDSEEILQKIIPLYLGGMLYSAVSEAVASECGARRTAMNSANKNAEEMIGSLMLKFNRARQAVITQEITEIVSGAEAL